MKLQDPRLEALLVAYRADRRPDEALREQMWQRIDAARRPRRAWARAAIATAVAVAALVLLWLAARELSQQAVRARGPGSGTQAPYGREGEPSRGTAVAGGDRVVSEGGRTPVEPTAESGAASMPPAASASASASEASEARDAKRAPAVGSRPASSAGPSIPEPAKSAVDDLALIEAAEAALRAADPTRALELLHTHERRHPGAPTAEEREALRVLALCAAGREVEGRGARWTFLREHPRSAYRERIEKACPAS